MPSPRKAQASQSRRNRNVEPQEKRGRQQGIACEGSRREGNAGHEAHHQGQAEEMSGHLKSPSSSCGGHLMWLSFESASANQTLAGRLPKPTLPISFLPPPCFPSPS